jgi:hypothetical protein
VLGKWRLRGSETGAIYVGRLDDDGAIVTDGWVNVASFVHNADNNVPGLDVQNLGVPGTATVGSLAAGTDVAADMLRARTANQLTVSDNLTVTGCMVVQDLSVQGNLSWSPFWIAGKVLGSQSSATIVNSKGRVGFTVSRRAAGQFIITFAEDHPDGSHSIASVSPQGTGLIKVQQFGSFAPRPEGLDVVIFNAGATNTVDLDFHLFVLA